MCKIKCGQKIKGGERKYAGWILFPANQLDTIVKPAHCTLYCVCAYTYIYTIYVSISETLLGQVLLPRAKVAQYIVVVVRVYLWMLYTAERWEVQTEREVMIQS